MEGGFITFLGLDPRYCRRSTLKPGFRFVEIPFKTGSTIIRSLYTASHGNRISTFRSNLLSSFSRVVRSYRPLNIKVLCFCLKRRRPLMYWRKIVWQKPWIYELHRCGMLWAVSCSRNKHKVNNKYALWSVGMIKLLFRQRQFMSSAHKWQVDLSF